MPVLETITGETIKFSRTGLRNKPLVVLLTAVGINLTYWDSQVEALCGAYDIMAVDVFDQDQAREPVAPFTFDQAVVALTTVIQDANAGPAHVVGLSVGGMIAQTFALAQPHLVRSLALLNTAATFSETARTALRERTRLTREQGMTAVVPLTLSRWFTQDFTRRRPDVIQRVATTLLARDANRHAAMWDMIAQLEVAACLPGLTHPALVLVGDQDTSTPLASAQLLAERIAGAPLVIIPNSAHITPLEAPETVNQLLQASLTAVDNPPVS